MHPILEQVLTAILVPLIPVLAGFLVALAKKGLDWLSVKLKIDNDNFYLDKIEKVIIDSIGYVNQTMVDTLKKEGAFTKEQQKIAFNLAKDRIESLVTAEGKEVVERLFGDYNAYMDGLLERLINQK